MKKLAIVPALHRATHRVGLYLQAHAPHVPQGQVHLLAHLHETGGASTVAELHRAWAHKRSTLTDTIDRLEKQGLVRRSVLPEDRRSVLVRLTAKGRRVAAAVHGKLAALERQILAQMRLGARASAGDLPGALENVSKAATSAAHKRKRAR